MAQTPRIYVCTGTHCASRLAQGVALFERAVRRSNANIDILASNCLNQCDHAPNALAQPQGMYYTKLTPDRIMEIIAQCNSNLLAVEPHSDATHGASSDS